MIEYGYINKEGYLVSKILEERKELYRDEDEKICERIITVEEQIRVKSEAGWKPVETIDEQQMICQENESVHIEPYDTGDRISYRYAKHFDKQAVKKKIREAKQQLSDSDYKVIKCYEASMLNKIAPYDVEAIHRERQVLRDKINDLENLLENQL